MTNPVDRYFTKEGVLILWPSPKRRELQEQVLRRLALEFEVGRDYVEKEVNEILKAKLIFEDYPLIRREMIELGVLCRTRDCRRYWRPDGCEP